MIHVDVDSFFVIVLVSALAAVTVAVLPARLAPPVVVVELFLGILVGPQVGAVLAALGVIDTFLYAGAAMATTAIGTPIPILRDSGELKTRFGTPAT